MTLLEIVVAGAILSVALLAAHYSATLAWALHRKGSFSSENTIQFWNRSCRFRDSPGAGRNSLHSESGFTPIEAGRAGEKWIDMGGRSCSLRKASP